MEAIMYLTVEKLIHLETFSHFRLIAGEKGLNRVVTKPGILDYEYDPRVTKRYIDINFHPGQFVFTTFLYAVGNEYLIFDAVKNLISRGASGLVIKNIFSITIPQNVINYANANDFPLFILPDIDIYHEDLIVEMYDAIHMLENSESNERLIDHIIENSDNVSVIKSSVYKLNPSFENNFFILYISFKNAYESVNYNYHAIFKRFDNNELLTKNGIYLKYKNGLMLVFSYSVFPAFHNDSGFQPSV